MRPDSRVDSAYAAAFRNVAARIAESLRGVPNEVLPISMYVAGGAALHFYTGDRVSRDIDASFSHRIALPENLEVAYRGEDGSARLLYFDRQYSDTFALMHEDARQDSIPLRLEDIDSKVLDVRLLSPMDLAVSKLARFSEQDRQDIASLAKHKRIRASALKKRAEQALSDYVGSTERIRASIEEAVRIVERVQKKEGDSR